MKLANREKYFVSIAAGIIFAFLFLQFLAVPFFEKRNRMRRSIEAMEKDIVEMVLLSGEYRNLKQESQNVQGLLAGRKKGFTLFSFLENAAGEAQVKENIKYMKPSISEGIGEYKESMVEMRLEELNLKQIVSYLNRIESSGDLVVVKRISIQGNKMKKGYIDAVLQVMTYQT
ncbi:MAG: hypothetical protein JW882_12935 [Deltaproteobacteria bacterium]|nr:hypothetical protein [Deltaproteobacteria bacterium]